MRHDGLDVIAPAAFAEEFSEAEVFGSAVWLWMHSAAHRDAPLQLLSTLLLPALKSRQFVLASDKGQPVFYLAWAALNADAEQRYLANPPQCMPSADWTSGDRLWLLDWVAPFGHTPRLRALVRRRLFAGRCVRALDHRGDERGLRVLSFHGLAVTRAEARCWFDRHPCRMPGRSR